MVEYKYPQDRGMAFKESKLKIGELFGGHSQRIKQHLGFYLPMEVELKIYNEMFDDTQKFNNKAERFMFDEHKLTWLKYKRSNIEPKIGDIYCSIYGGFNSSNGGVRLTVTDIEDRFIKFNDYYKIMKTELAEKALFIRRPIKKRK